MTLNDEHASKLESWDKLAEIWQGQPESRLNDNSGKKKMNDYLEKIRQTERREFFELIIDVLIGMTLIAVGSAIAIDFFTFYPLIPTTDQWHSGHNWLTGKSETTDFMLMIYGIGYISIIVFVVLGLFLLLRSYWLRKVFWRQAVFSSADARIWFTRFFDNKIKLCRLSQQVAFYLAAILWSVFIIGQILIKRPLHFEDTHLLLARISLLIVLPLTIFLAAKWQENKFKKAKQNILRLLDI